MSTGYCDEDWIEFNNWDITNNMKKILTEEKVYLAWMGVKKETNTEELEEMNTTADQN